jgi:gliding motility-associated-like protein
LAPEITVQLGEEYQLEAGLNLNLDQISSIIWNSDADLSCSDCLNPVIINYQDGDFIQLLVVSETDCEAVAETRIRVEDNKVPIVYIPNVFSPNNTVNFTIYASEQIGTIQHMYIYDRWGELMFTNENFEPNQPELGWDGTFDNKRVEQGVYVYLFIYELDGRIIREFGDITLLW